MIETMEKFGVKWKEVDWRTYAEALDVGRCYATEPDKDHLMHKVRQLNRYWMPEDPPIALVCYEPLGMYEFKRHYYIRGEEKI